MNLKMVLGCGSVAIAALLLAPARASANPKTFTFTYTYPTQAKGDVEIEQYIDLLPLKAVNASSGEQVPYLGTQLMTELEIGITDRLELGLYATIVPRPGDKLTSVPNLPGGNGAKQRLRYRFADEGAWPLDVGLYGEIAENERELEFEAKLLLARRFGSMLIAANAIGEAEVKYDGEVEFAVSPTAGISYQVTPAFQPGLEYWSKFKFSDEPDSKRGFNDGPHHYVGPVMLFNFGRAWWSTGAYFRMSDLGHAVVPADKYAPIWFRTVVGVGF